jgi:VanZ family protein
MAVIHGGWIWWLSSRSFDGPAGKFWGFASNCVHFGLFFVLAVLLLEAARSGNGWSRDALIGVMVLVATWGIVDEWHQSATPGRSPDPFDVCVDLLGGMAAVSLWWGVRGPGRIGKALWRTTALTLLVVALNAWRTYWPVAS